MGPPEGPPSSRLGRGPFFVDCILICWGLEFIGELLVVCRSCQSQGVGARLELPATTRAQLPRRAPRSQGPPSPGLAGPGRGREGWAEEGQWAARRPLHPVCSACHGSGPRLTGCPKGSRLSPALAAPPPICELQHLLLSPAPRLGVQPARVPPAACGTRVWGKLSLQDSQRDQVSLSGAGRIWSTPIRILKSYHPGRIDSEPSLMILVQSQSREQVRLHPQGH